MTEYVNFSNNGDRKMTYRLFGGEEDSEHNVFGFVEISNIFSTQERFSIEREEYDGVYSLTCAKIDDDG